MESLESSTPRFPRPNGRVTYLLRLLFAACWTVLGALSIYYVFEEHRQPAPDLVGTAQVAVVLDSLQKQLALHVEQLEFAAANTIPRLGKQAIDPSTTTMLTTSSMPRPPPVQGFRSLPYTNVGLQDSDLVIAVPIGDEIDPDLKLYPLVVQYLALDEWTSFWNVHEPVLYRVEYKRANRTQAQAWIAQNAPTNYDNWQLVAARTLYTNQIDQAQVQVEVFLGDDDDIDTGRAFDRDVVGPLIGMVFLWLWLFVLHLVLDNWWRRQYQTVWQALVRTTRDMDKTLQSTPLSQEPPPPWAPQATPTEFRVVDVRSGDRPMEKLTTNALFADNKRNVDAPDALFRDEPDVLRNTIIENPPDGLFHDDAIPDGEHGLVVGSGHQRNNDDDPSSASSLTGSSGSHSSWSGPQANTKADFFPHCTVVVGTLDGFDEWALHQDPVTVFGVLQQLHYMLDQQAQDDPDPVYVIADTGCTFTAVTGLQDRDLTSTRQSDHAARCARFCTQVQHITSRLLRRQHGNDWTWRMGVQAGPVTAGQVSSRTWHVLGDALAQARVVQGLGICCTSTVANLLKKTACAEWVHAAPDNVFVLDRGDETTALPAPEEFSLGGGSVSLASDTDDLQDERVLRKTHGSPWGTAQVLEDAAADDAPKKRKRGKTKSLEKRLIDWNVKTMGKLVQQIMGRRELLVSSSGEQSIVSEASTINTGSLFGQDEVGYAAALRDNESSVHNDLTEVIGFSKIKTEANEDYMELEIHIEDQLRKLITTIASMYRDHAFHNYEHACHVQMALLQLLQRSSLPQCADPLVQFAALWAALVHDVDHTGVSNEQLVAEHAHIAAVYKNKSIAQQNAIDLAWDVFIGDEYKELRSCLYQTEREWKQVRQLTVNLVLATDIWDDEWQTLRQERWDRAFNAIPQRMQLKAETVHDKSNRRATVALEHLMQAAVVSHALQDWSIYRKWNERLFYEGYQSFVSGRTTEDPCTTWFANELQFLDSLVVPLTTKLRVVLDDAECVQFAPVNREKWKSSGDGIAQETLASEKFAAVTARYEKQPPALSEMEMMK